MNLNQTSISSHADQQVETACGARIILSSDTPFIHYRDEIVYFCGQDCKQLYDSDPFSSCMAAQLLAGR
jgi:YHS domain-containing protein